MHIQLSQTHLLSHTSPQSKSDGDRRHDVKSVIKWEYSSNSGLLPVQAIFLPSDSAAELLFVAGGGGLG